MDIVVVIFKNQSFSLRKLQPNGHLGWLRDSAMKPKKQQPKGGNALGADISKVPKP